jgi:fumarate hydratase subunit beta
MVQLRTPLQEKDIEILKAGDRAQVTGTIYTARDKAHQRLKELIQEGKKLPFDLEGQVIFYAGPARARPGRVIGSIGPTTSARMDAFTPLLLEHGLKGMIGKGNRSEKAIEAIRDHKAIYLVATGGAAAFLSQYVIRSTVLAFADLGPEAIYQLEVEDFPVIVGIDSSGRNVFEEASRRFGSHCG